MDYWDDAEKYCAQASGGSAEGFHAQNGTRGLCMFNAVVPKQACYPFIMNLPYCQTTHWTVQSK